MMSIRILWNLDVTIDPATGRSPVADAVAAAWDHDPGSVRFFRTSANSIYRLSVNGRPAYLRMAPGTERTSTSIRQELDLLAWLTAHDVPVVHPIPARSGDLVITVGTTIGPIHAVLFDALPGEIRDLDTLDLDAMTSWGATVGRLHATMQDAPATLRRPAGWAAALAWLVRKQAAMPEAVAAEGLRLREFLLTQPRTPDRYGLLHTDLELDNLVWTGSDVAVLDFDEYGEGWYGLDIAKALSDVFEAGDALDSPRVQAFVTGYRRFQALTDEDLALVPTFRDVLALRMYCVLFQALNMEPEDAPVAWLRDLIVRLRDRMTAYVASLTT
jgi:Ser/Thr protein kinase RdoA (MazF antagonist)